MIIVEPSAELLWITPDAEKVIEAAGRTCFHPDTDILTDIGWRPIHEVDEQYKVLTFDRERQHLTYQPVNMVVKDYQGPLVCSRHANLRFKVTPDHRMFACKSHHRLGDATASYDFVPACAFLENNRNAGFRVPRWFRASRHESGLPWLGIGGVGEPPTSIETDDYVYESGRPLRKMSVPGRTYPMGKPLLTLLAAYIAEGHIGKPKGSAHYVAITQGMDEPLYRLIVEAADALSIDFRCTPKSQRPHIIDIRLTGGRPFVRLIEESCGRYSENKKIPAFVRRLPRDLMQHFLDVLYMGDGSGNTTKTEKYLSISETLVDQVQELHILLGKSASKGFMSSEKWINCDGLFYAEESQRDSWIVKPEQCYEEQYDGLVYCPSTDNGIVCVRMDGKPFWCGNCYKSESRITPDSAAAFIHKIMKSGHHSVIEHASASFRFICDRGVTHEMVRHRLVAYSQESTRWCNYGKKKFGGEIKVIQPPFVDKEWGHVEAEKVWAEVVEQAEKAYLRLLALGQPTEIARSVLPNCLKTEIVATANLREWLHIFSLRTDDNPRAHPQIREIMNQAQHILRKQCSAVFGEPEDE